MNVLFDTLTYAKGLKAVGFTEEQAEFQAKTLTEIIESELATKRDLKELEVGLKRDMKEIELRMERNMKELELKMVIKLGGIVVACAAICTTILAVLMRIL